tara:strand:+ start:297 stop:953 length:657 start_codon:yes stop_codon:yes gene_type:complete
MDSVSDIERRRVNFHYYVPNGDSEIVAIIGRTVPVRDTELSEFYLPYPSSFQSHVLVDIEKVQPYFYDHCIKQLVLVPFSSYLPSYSQVYLAMPSATERLLSYAKKLHTTAEKAQKRKKEDVIPVEKVVVEASGDETSDSARQNLGKNTLERTDFHDANKEDASYRRRRYVVIQELPFKRMNLSGYLNASHYLILYYIFQVYIRHGKIIVSCSTASWK